MQAERLSIPDVIVFTPDIHTDSRGYFFESFNENKFLSIIGRQIRFVQDNRSFSKKNVLRGMHYQIGHPQGKLVQVISGRIFDVVIDLRKDSPTFGRWVGQYLSHEACNLLWIPEGFAHGFLVMDETAEVLYKSTDYWYPEQERCICWDDSRINIQWPLKEIPVLSEKDSLGVCLADAEVYG